MTRMINVKPGSLRAGTMMVRDGVLMPASVEIDTDAYSPGWRSVRTFDSFNVGRMLAAAGWHLFFIAGHVTTIALGRGGEGALHRAMKRIAAQVSKLNFNCLEISDVVRKHFFGFPYALVSAHAYQIQPGWQIEDCKTRVRLQRDADYARQQ